MQQKVFDDYFLPSETLRPKDGLMIAAAVTRFAEIPAEIGALNFYRKQFTPDTDLNITRLDSRPCTREDFNINGTNQDASYFFGTYKTAGELEYYLKEFRCLVNPEDVYINGNYETDVATAFMVVFERCNQTESKVPCASKEKQDLWIDDQYIITIDN